MIMFMSFRPFNLLVDSWNAAWEAKGEAVKAASLNGSEPKHGKARAGKDGGLEDTIGFECVSDLWTYLDFSCAVLVFSSSLRDCIFRLSFWE